MPGNAMTLDDCSRVSKLAIEEVIKKKGEGIGLKSEDEDAMLFVEYWRAYDRLRQTEVSEDDDTPLSWDDFMAVLISISKQPNHLEQTPDSQEEEVPVPEAQAKQITATTAATDPTNLVQCSVRTQKAIKEVQAEWLCSAEPPRNFTRWREDPEVYFKYQRKHTELLHNDPEGKHIEQFDLPLTWQQFKVVLDSMEGKHRSMLEDIAEESEN